MEELYLQIGHSPPSNFTGISIYANGSKIWYVDGKISRLDGPAYEHANGGKFWFVDDKLSRLDGPAIEDTDGYKDWYIDDKCLTFIEFWERQKDTEYAPVIMAYMLGAKK